MILANSSVVLVGRFCCATLAKLGVRRARLRMLTVFPLHAPIAFDHHSCIHFLFFVLKRERTN